MSISKLYEKYKDEKLKFDNYYKYSFYYSNDKISVKVGGDSSDIYRAELSPIETLESLKYECGDEYMEIWEK